MPIGRSRRFLHFVAICFLLSVGLANVQVLGQDSARPNVLWIIAEDMGPELGCYGTKEARTPVLDQLADRSMLYEKAFTVTPVCSTSRSSFMTGMYAMSIDAHHHRSHRNGTNPLPTGVRVLTDWLRDGGYTTANLRNLTNDKQLRKLYKGTGKTDWNFNYPKDRKPFDVANWDELKKRQPFYAQVNFSETHRGAAWNKSHAVIDDPADPQRIELPPYYPDHWVSRAVWAQYLNTVMAVDKKVGFILDLLRRDGLDSNTIVVFMGDHGRAMPRGKQWPYDSGLRIPLIIHWPEGNAKLKEPSGYHRGSRSNQLVESIDLTATTLAWAGLVPPPKMQGRVLMGNNAAPPRDYAFAGRDRGDETVLHVRTLRDQRYRYLRNGYPERPFLQLNRYKESSYPIIGLMRHLHAEGKLNGPPAALMNSQRPSEELYDLEQDPWEIHNLADSPQHAEIKHRLSSELDKTIERIGDRGRKPEDPEIVAAWEAKMKSTYQYLADRPANWFESHPSLGAYRNPSP